jgi:hypothetical protein
MGMKIGQAGSLASRRGQDRVAWLGMDGAMPCASVTSPSPAVSGVSGGRDGTDTTHALVAEPPETAPRCRARPAGFETREHPLGTRTRSSARTAGPKCRQPWDGVDSNGLRHSMGNSPDGAKLLWCSRRAAKPDRGMVDTRRAGDATFQEAGQNEMNGLETRWP